MGDPIVLTGGRAARTLFSGAFCAATGQRTAVVAELRGGTLGLHKLPLVFHALGWTRARKRGLERVLAALALALWRDALTIPRLHPLAMLG